MPKLKGELGVDFVFFDGEEFVFRDGDAYFIGCEYFAHELRRRIPTVPAIAGPCCSTWWATPTCRFIRTGKPCRGTTRGRWSKRSGDTARRLGVVEFVIDKRCEVLDDHVKLHNLGGIPSCDILDFKYPAWHTQDDTPERCSALSLAKVGWVVHDWLQQAVKKP